MSYAFIPSGKPVNRKTFHIKFFKRFLISLPFPFHRTQERVGNFIAHLSQAGFQLPDNEPPAGDESQFADFQQAERNDWRHRSICFPRASTQHIRHRNGRSSNGENLLYMGQRLRRPSASSRGLDLRLVDFPQGNGRREDRILLSCLRPQRRQLHNTRRNVYFTEVTFEHSVNFFNQLNVISLTEIV